MSALFYFRDKDVTNVIAESIQKARVAMSKRAFGESKALLDEVLSAEPDNFEGRYTLAVLHRAQGQPENAKVLLEALVAEKPDFGRGFQELGLCELALKREPAAITAFEQAVEHDGSLIDSWKFLTTAYRRQGDTRAEQAAMQVDFLASLPNELRTVISYLAANRMGDAERLCRFFLQQNKTHVEGMRLMAEIATRTGVFDDAEFLLETVMELAPDHIEAEIQLAHVLLRRQRFHKAHKRVTSIYNRNNNPSPQVKALYASVCFGVGENEEAIKTYQDMIRVSPNDPQLRVSLAHIYNATGESSKAVDLFKQAYSLKNDFGDAFWSLANTKSYRFTEAELTAMTHRVDSPSTPQLDKIQMHFALGKAHEDSKDFDTAFRHYQEGNALKRETSTHSKEQLDIRISSQLEVCTSDLFERLNGVGHDAPDPIFILGLPRAGSTLLEQILASHSKVDGTMELHDILDLAKRLRGRDKSSDPSPRYPRILSDLPTERFTQFGQQFIEDTRAYRGNAPFFIDKMPNNFFHIGLIKLILPNAKVIDARRHPMACCFSGYKQLFGEGQEFSYGLEEIGNYYRQYVDLMDHWNAVLPGFVLQVQHEDVIADLEGQVRRILDFCGLEFEEACVEFHKTKRTVRTPSAEQVRQPINTSGVDQWCNFEAHLDPLKRALGPAILDTYGVTPPA